jgi:hypothetical protein
MAAPVVEWKESNGRFTLWMNNVPTDYLQWNEADKVYVTRKREPVAQLLEEAKVSLEAYYADYLEHCRRHKEAILHRPSPHPPKLAKTAVAKPDAFYDDLSQYFL